MHLQNVSGARPRAFVALRRQRADPDWFALLSWIWFFLQTWEFVGGTKLLWAVGRTAAFEGLV